LYRIHSNSNINNNPLAGHDRYAARSTRIVKG